MKIRRSLAVWGAMAFLVVAAGCGSASSTQADALSGQTGTGDAPGPGTRGPACAPDLPVPAEGFVRIPAGSFLLGSPEGELGRTADEEQVSVTLTRDFWLQSTVVTQGAYGALMGRNPSHFSGCGASCPVESVTWFDAIAYANALSRSEGLPECYDASGRVIGGETVYDCCGYRLPTEAEWEYAARAGTSTATYLGDLTGDPFYSCDSQPNLDSIAWWCGNADERPHPVGSLAPNAWGLHDMLGNVWEWTDTRYSDTHSGGVDPVGPASGSARVIRGGSWDDEAGHVRAGSRGPFSDGFPADEDEVVLGFRLARTAGQ